MKKLSIYAFAFFLVLFSFMSCAKKPAAPKAGEAKAEDMLSLLPKEADGVVLFDFHKAMTTELANKAIKEDENYQKYQEFIKDTGIDPQKDIYFIAFAWMKGLNPMKQEGAAVVNLKYDRETLLAKIKEEQTVALKTEEYNGITIYTIDDIDKARPTTGAFLDDSNIVIGNAEGVRAVIDVLQKRKENVLKNEALLSLIKNADKGAMMWSAIHFQPETMKDLAAQNPMLSSLEGVKSILMSFDYKNKFVIADIRALGADEAKNKQIADLLNGLKAMGAMASTEEVNFGELLNRIEITADPDHVRIYASLPEDLLKEIGESLKKDKEGYN